MKNDLVEETEKRIQFVGLLVFFFPTLINSLFTFSGSDGRDIGKITLQWSVLIVLFIIQYVFFEKTKHTISDKVLKCVNGSLFFSIFCFAYIIFFFSMNTSDQAIPFAQYLILLFEFALYAIIAAPVFSLVAMGSQSLVAMFKGTRLILSFFGKKLLKK
jgi:hypothetical protein